MKGYSFSGERLLSFPGLGLVRRIDGVTLAEAGEDGAPEPRLMQRLRLTVNDV